MIHRNVTDHLLQALTDTPVVLVNGARQTGKSTLVQSSELTESGRQYLTFDDPSILAAAKRDHAGHPGRSSARTRTLFRNQTGR